MSEKLRLAFWQFGFALCMLGGSLYFEYVAKLVPCALCLIQRGIVLCILCVSALKLLRLYYSCHARWCDYIVAVFSILGVLVAWRHIWLQMHIDSLGQTTCLPDLKIMLKMMPISDVIVRIATQAGSECGQIKWAFMGVSMPMWVLIAYIAMFFGTVYCIMRASKS